MTYRIRYTDATDPGCPVFSCRIRAYDREHAREVFHDSDDDGWRIVSIQEVRK